MNREKKKILRAVVLALRTIRNHKLRTSLALLGVVIGVFSVVVVTALGAGIKQFVLGEVESFGTNLIQIEVKIPNTGTMSARNAASRAQGAQIMTLTTDDEKAIRKLPTVVAAYAGTIGQERATVGSRGKRILLFGTGNQVPLVDDNLKIADGRFFTAEENENQARVVVLGSEVKETFFGSGNALGEVITIKGEKYRVVGVLAPRGAAAFFNLDALAYVPVETLLSKILGIDYVQMISVKMKDSSREAETVADIVALLRSRHDIDDPRKDDFLVTSTKEAQKTIEDVLGALTVLLLALTSISLVVGGVGIMNVMYVSVAERTSEIGLRKALGAKSSDILSQFFLEALLITGIGGIIGTFLGMIVVMLFTFLLEHLGYPLELLFTPQSLFLGTSFSLAVGLIFGLAPALKASQLSPMEALRKE